MAAEEWYLRLARFAITAHFFVCKDSFRMSRKLFVGGLSWNTNDDGLRMAFERFGNIDEAKVIIDRETGRSRGFGFVTFNDAESARSAMGEMNGQALDGRNIKVNEAEEKPRGGGGGGGRSFGGGGGGYGGGGGGYGGGGGGGGGRGGYGRRDDDGGNRW